MFIMRDLKSVKVSTVYNRRKGRHRIEIRVYFKHDQSQIYLSTGISVPPEDWDKRLKAIKPSVDYIQKQRTIDQILDDVEFVARKLERENGEITKSSFLEAYRGEKSYQKKRDALFYLYCAKVVEESPISEGSKRAQRRTVSLIKEFSPTITFDEVNASFVKQWDNFLHTKYSNLNTIAGHHKDLKKFCYAANAEGLLSDDNFRSFKKFKAPKIKGTRVSLMPEQVEAIEKLEYPKLSLMDNVRNMFLFGCYTGLRISDITELERKHIVSGDSRGLLIKKPIHKLRHLNRIIELPVEKLFNGKPYKLMQLYMEKDPERETVFPHYAHQVLNRYLKKVAYDAKIDFDLTFHYARHTFLTIMALKTKDLFAVMNYGGITSVNTAQGYIHMASQWLDKGLQNVDWTLKV